MTLDKPLDTAKQVVVELEKAIEKQPNSEPLHKALNEAKQEVRDIRSNR